MMRVLSIGAMVVLLSGCGMEDSTTPTQPDVLPFANSFVNCGEVTREAPGPLVWAISRPSDWVVMGSSTAAGAGASSSAKSWVGLVSSGMTETGATVHNIAKGGYTTYQALAASCVVASERPKTDPLHNLDLALTYKPDVVLLNFPSNDAVSGFAATETAFNIMLLRQQLAEKNVATVVLMAQPRNTSKAAQQRMLELDALLKPLLGNCQVELHSLLAGTDGGLATQYDSGDGVHLNDAGHKIVADAVLAVIESKKCVVAS